MYLVCIFRDLFVFDHAALTLSISVLQFIHADGGKAHRFDDAEDRVGRIQRCEAADAVFRGDTADQETVVEEVVLCGSIVLMM